MYQYIVIRDANKYEFITEATFEDKLKADEIEYVNLPKLPIKDQYVSAKPKIFNEEDVDRLRGQSVTIVKDTTIKAVFDKPLQLTPKKEQTELSALLLENIFNGEDYVFWKKDEKKNTYTFFQQYKNKPFYENINGRLIFQLDKNNKLLSYEQTYLDGVEELTKEDVLSPLKAIETLHQKGLLKPKTKVTKMQLGYSTLVQLAASQVLTPTWQIVVNGEESLFVNAFEGQIIQFDNEENNIVE